MIRARVLSFLGPDDWLRAWVAGFASLDVFYAMARADPSDTYAFVCNIKAWMFTLPDCAFAVRFRHEMRFVPRLGVAWTDRTLVWDFSLHQFSAFIRRLKPVSRTCRVTVTSEDDLLSLVSLTQANVVAVCVVHEQWSCRVPIPDTPVRLRELWLSYPLKNSRGLKKMTGAKHYDKYWPLMSVAVDRWVA